MPKGFSKSIHASVILLTLFGLAMIVSATATVNTLEWTRLVFVIIKESTFIVISYVLMVLVARKFSFNFLRKNYGKFLLLTIGGLALTMAFPAINGAKAWIRIPGLGTIQPSEFAKVAVILILAISLNDKDIKEYSFWDVALHPIVVVTGIALYVFIFQNDLGSAMIILMIAFFTLMVFANSKLQKVQTFLLAVFIGFLVLLLFVGNEGFINFVDKLPFIDDYMIDRLRVSGNPFLDRHGSSAQIFNGLAAFVNGGLFGVGYGKGFLKFSFIFAAESDSILAIIVEELGVIFGFLPIVILYSIIMFQLIKYTFLVDSERDKAVLVGSLAYFFVHFLLNVGGITALIPLTGVPLLFISAGGSSRLAVMIMIGLSQNVIARYNQKGMKKVS